MKNRRRKVRKTRKEMTKGRRESTKREVGDEEEEH